MFDELWSDPGSNLTSEAVQLLNQWFGIRHVFSLVDRHQSNGTEGSNKAILRFLRVLTHDERMVKKWSHPTVLPFIFFTINDSINSETGVRPLDAKYGSEVGTYLRMPECGDPKVMANAWLRNLNTNLAEIRAISKKHQDQLVAERTAENPPVHQQNQYQPGDFILYQYPKDRFKPTKLSSPYFGPYVVIKHERNNVMVMGTIRVFHVSEVKLFIGTEDEAKTLAQTDADQHLFQSFNVYVGDPSTRTTVEFEVQFMDGSIMWLEWSKDLFDTTQYEQFCRDNMELFPLLYTVKASKTHITAVRSQNITLVQPNDVVYLKLRNICPYWYDTLENHLHDIYHVQYVIKLQYTDWVTPTSRKHIKAIIPVFNHTLSKLDNYFVTFYGQLRTFTPSMVLVDDDFLATYPTAKPNRQLLLQLPKKP